MAAAAGTQPTDQPPTAQRTGLTTDQLMTDADLAALRRSCNRFLNGHGALRAGDWLDSIASLDVEIDRYGDGGVVSELEAEVAAILGKPAALFVPSGTMAQQATLRVHAERTGRGAIVWHPMCHLDWREGRAYQRLHDLVAVPAGDPGALLSLDDLSAIREAPAALLLELPQRDLGGVLPEWDDLVAQVGWARDRGAAVHLDGARLWEATPWYGRSPAEIAALFDTIYVSFYKGLGGIAGCCVAGPTDIVGEVSEWRTRHGGRLYGLWPYAAAALAGLRTRLPLMTTYYDHAGAIAEALHGVPGVTVLPDPPQSPMMHLQLTTTVPDLERRAVAIARRDGIFTFPRAYSTPSPALQRLELTVGDATLGFSPDEVRALVAELVTPVVAGG